ncbi:MAG: alpha/beta hydrolase [Eubacteriales bacterium]
MKVYKKKWFKIISILIAVILLLFGAFFVYTLDYSRPADAALAALEDTGSVDVSEKSGMIIFSPKGDSTGTGFAFYPGGKVDYRSYAPLMADLAGHGVTCVLLKMPFQLAVFDINAADRAISALPQITRWYVGGHSLGGVMASSFAAGNTDKVEGVVFLAAYPSGDITDSGLRVLTLYGSNDGVLNMDSFRSSKDKAPQDTVYLEIPGGNHAGFGSYGAQKGDNAASISPEEQLKETAGAIVLFFNGEDPAAAIAQAK